MAFPLLLASGATIAATGAVGAAAGFMQADAAADAARQNAAFQANVARQNAEFSRELGERNAQQAMISGADQARRLQRQRDRELARAAATFGASGAQLTGSPLEVLADQAMESALEVNQVRFGAQEEARQQRFAGQIGARNFLLEGLGALNRGETQATFARAQGIGSLLGGIGQSARGFGMIGTAIETFGAREQ